MSVRNALLIAGITLIAGSWMTLSVANQPSDADKPRIVLTKIHEQRVERLVEPEEDKRHSLSLEKPGLNLTFNVDLPEGQRLLDVSEPSNFTAKDSTGTDLTQIEKNVMGERDYIELAREFNKPAKKFMMQLALTERKATSFNLQGDVTITSFAGTETEEVALSTNWTQLDSDLFGDQTVRCRLQSRESFNGEKVPELTFEPGAIKNAIEEIELVRNGRSISSQGSMWNNEQATYIFDGPYHKDYRAKITVRTNVNETPIQLKITDHELP